MNNDFLCGIVRNITWDGDNEEDFLSEGFDCVLKYTRESKENGSVLHLYLSDTHVCSLAKGESLIAVIQYSKGE